MNDETENGDIHFGPVIAAIRAQRDVLMALPEVFGITPGLRVKGAKACAIC